METSRRPMLRVEQADIGPTSKEVIIALYRGIINSFLYVIFIGINPESDSLRFTIFDSLINLNKTRSLLWHFFYRRFRINIPEY